MTLKRLLGIRKSRKYPIKRDSRGQSLRARCFQLFDEGKRPVEVAKELGMKESTAKRYFQDWKRLGPNFERKHTYIQGLLKKSAPDRDHTLELLARACGIPKENLETILAQPHGLRRLMTGKLYFSGHADADHRLHVVLEVSLFISDYLMKNGGKFEDVHYALERWMKENQEFRKAKDADIKENNRDIALIRQVLEAAVKAEQQGRV
jgi:AraC-like DNA-binding protein